LEGGGLFFLTNICGVKTTGCVVVLVGERLLNGEALNPEGKVQVQVRVSQHHSESGETSGKQATQIKKVNCKKMTRFLDLF